MAHRVDSGKKLTASAPQVNESSSDIECGSNTKFAISELPYETLVKLSLNLPAQDLLHGLSQVNRRLHSLFKEDAYWMTRMRHVNPELCISYREKYKQKNNEPHYWRKCSFNSEQIRRKFAGDATRLDVWAVSGDHDFLSDPDFGAGDGEGTVDLSCIAFCDNGNMLVSGDSNDGLILYWNLRNKPELESPKSMAVHSSVICSMRAQGSRLTSSSECEIALIDMKHCSRETTMIRCGCEVYSHAWMEDLIVAGEHDGTLELFDLRSPSTPQMRVATEFEDIGYFDGNEVELIENYVLSAGWLSNRRVIKQLDMRMGQFINHSTVPEIVMPPPGGHWAANNRFKAVTCVDDVGHYWIGAEGGKVFEYDAQSLELLKDHTEDLNHTNTSHIVGLQVAYGHVASLSKAGRPYDRTVSHRLTLHALRKKAELLWERKISPYASPLPVLAFDSEKCSIGIAASDSVQLWRTD